jgi:hypothetical protein
MAAGEASPPGRAKLEVADIFRTYGSMYRMLHRLSLQELRVMRAIQRCRTAELGGHLEVCDTCGYSRPAYNSCRDRHCPKCQSLRQAAWLAARMERLLEVPYFHVVFTLPSELRPLCRNNPREMYDLLFEAASQTLLRLGHDPKRLGARLAFTAVLHTWTRELHYHPHLHCIVSAGGLSEDGTRFVYGNPRFLFPVQVMGALFRGLFLAELKKRQSCGKIRTEGLTKVPNLDALYRTKWVVYTKRPFGGPEQVLSYLGRYTHRVGISNQRLISMDAQGICFSTKGGKRVTLAPEEFIRRFLLHVLPPGFLKIRHYGLWASACAEELEKARRLLQAEVAARPQAPRRYEAEQPAPKTAHCAPKQEVLAKELAAPVLQLSGLNGTQCPTCQRGRMVQHPLPPASAALAPRGTDTS